MFKPVTQNVNFPELEKKILDHWYSEGIVEKYLHKNDQSKKRFSFLDGPITANNPMGVHHAWGRTYKDLWQRYFNMRGYKQRFQNGFDCQGLWIEVEVEKELGIRNKKDIENLVPGDKKKSIAKFVQLCKDRVLKFSKMQTEQTKRLGNFMDWDNSYYTMSDENNYMIWYFLKICHEKGWIYKGRDSVPWCPRCETAISQHEMLTEDYKELVHESIYFRLPIIGKKYEYLLVWTTTPWTIPANIAVAIDKTLEYSLVQTDDGKKYWIVKELAESIFSEKKKIIKTVKGGKLVGLRYNGPFDHLEAVKKVASQNPNTFHTVIETDSKILPISTTEGTGMVHTAVSAGAEDFKLGKKLGLPMIPVIADNADYLSGLGYLSHKNAKKNPRLILDYMEENGWAYKIHKYKHRYPACWRCKTELVWKVAQEWYIAMDRYPLQVNSEKSKVKNSNNNKTLREMMMDVARNIKWKPGFGLDRELDWLKNMHDWLISKKNRYWGLALPIYECQKCGWFDVLGSREELKHKTVSGWNEFEGHSPHKPYVDEIKIKCQKCNLEIPRIDDVGNVWLDAGIVPFSSYVDPMTKKLSYTTDKKYWRAWFPADFITESFPGQFKNWFYSMIAMSTVLEYQNPYKTVLGFASMLGEDGRPMHKSWGNAIDFNTGAEKIGVDVMRWMFATHDPEQNLLFGYIKADDTRRKFHLMLWNVYNFFVSYANIIDWQHNTNREKSGSDNTDPQGITILDKWIVSRSNNLIKTVTYALNKYESQIASNAIQEFLNDLSLWYVRRSRDRINPAANNTEDRDACLSTLYDVLLVLVKLLAPFTPFLAEEIYRNLTSETSVHLVDWPDYKADLIDEKIEVLMTETRKIAELGHAKRKAVNIKVRQPLSTLKVKNSRIQTGSDYLKLIKDELNVKNIYFKPGKGTLQADLDTSLTHELKKEGEARDIVREIQLKRREAGCGLTQKIKITLPDWPVDYEEYIRNATLAENITKGEILTIEKI